jgi:cytochrome c556
MISISLLVLITILVSTNANSEQSAEDIIKNRQALFSKNYNTAKKVQSLSSNGDFDKAKELMLEMSENYITLKEMFPENTKEGFNTEALPLIWEEKDKFNSLMEKTSNDMVQLASIIENEDDIRGTLKKLMWSNCKACHSKYRIPH